MIKYKFDVSQALATAGMTAYKAKKTGIISQNTWRKIKNGDTSISMESLNRICAILNMQPELILYYCKDEEEEKEILKKFNKQSCQHNFIRL